MFPKFIKDIKGVFKLPKKQWYFGKLAHGTPYFNPFHFLSTIISFRKLKLRTEDDRKEYLSKYAKWYTPSTYDIKNSKFSNLPMVRRNKETVIKLFKNYYFIQIGWPILITWYDLGHKQKYDSPRFEWSPSFQIYFFGVQFCIWWNAPKLKNEKYPDNDLYYEMILWYVYYADKDINKAKETWGWTDGDTKLSTWNDEYLK